MEKLLLILIPLAAVAVLTVVFFLIASPGKTDLAITEICFHPTKDSEDKLFPYIEVVNVSEKPVDLQEGSVICGSETNTIHAAASETLAPGQVAVLTWYGEAESAAGFRCDSGTELLKMLDAFNERYKVSVSLESFYVIQGSFSPDSTGSSVRIRLLDSDGRVLAESLYDAQRYDARERSVSYRVLWDGTTRLLGLTAMTPGVLPAYRHTDGKSEIYPETIRFLEYNVAAVGGETGESDDTVPDDALLIRNRGEYVIRTITNFDPDVAVLTEFNGAWYRQFQSLLYGKDSKYDAWGLSDFGHSLGSQSGLWDTMKLIIYNREIYDLIDRGSFWAATDYAARNTYISPDLAMQAAHCFNWVKLKNKTTGAVFCVLAIHFAPNTEWVKTTYGADGSLRMHRFEAELAMTRMAEIAGGAPVIIAGDFNFNETESTYYQMLEGGYEDAKNLQDDALFKGTCPGFQIRNVYNKLAIDHIFLSANDFAAEQYSVEENCINADYYASDHLPVHVILHTRNQKE